MSLAVKHKLSSILMLIGSILEWSIWCMGVTALALVVLNFVHLIRIHFLRAPTSYKTYGAADAYWAVVTGASDGIGKQYAIHLAKRGFNVVLISRSESKLNDVATEIKSSTQAATKVVVCDLAKATPSDFDKMCKDLAQLKIGVLVNNAGLSHELPERFGEADAQRIRDIINVNIVAVNEITYRLLPTLQKNKAAGRRALILNIGSASGIAPTPYLAAYAASKSYLAAWSSALQHEYRSDCIDVDCPLPFFVVSNMSKRSRPSAAIPSAETYVKASLAKAGHFDAPFAPYFLHGLMEFVIRSVPVALTQMLVAQNKAMHVDIRKRALKKAEREKATVAPTKK